MIDFQEIYDKIGYVFKDESLLARALTHKSADIENNYERLEFFGDSIVGYAVSEMLYHDSELSPGEMTEKRKSMVSKEPLAFLAKELGFLSHCKRNCAFKDKKESDLYESVTAAIALDGGLDAAIAFVLRTIPSAISDPEDHISKLKELCEKNGWEDPEYSFVEIGGEKNKKFSVEVYVRGKSVASATADAKKQARKQAAALALKKLKQQ